MADCSWRIAWRILWTKMFPWAELLPRWTRAPWPLSSSPLLSIRGRKQTLCNLVKLFRCEWTERERERREKLGRRGRHESIVVPRIRETRANISPLTMTLSSEKRRQCQRSLASESTTVFHSFPSSFFTLGTEIRGTAMKWIRKYA